MNGKVKALLMTAAISLAIVALYDKGYLEKLGLSKSSV